MTSAPLVIQLPIGNQLTWEEIQVLEDINKQEIDYDEFEFYHGYNHDNTILALEL